MTSVPDDELPKQPVVYFTSSRTLLFPFFILTIFNQGDAKLLLHTTVFAPEPSNTTLVRE